MKPSWKMTKKKIRKKKKERALAGLFAFKNWSQLFLSMKEENESNSFSNPLYYGNCTIYLITVQWSEKTHQYPSPPKHGGGFRNPALYSAAAMMLTISLVQSAFTQHLLRAFSQTGLCQELEMEILLRLPLGLKSSHRRLTRAITSSVPWGQKMLESSLWL